MTAAETSRDFASMVCNLIAASNSSVFGSGSCAGAIVVEATVVFATTVVVDVVVVADAAVDGGIVELVEGVDDSGAELSVPEQAVANTRTRSDPQKLGFRIIPANQKDPKRSAHFVARTLATHLF